MLSRAIVIVVAALVNGAALAAAQEASPAPGVLLRYAFKGSVVLSRLPDAPLLFPQRDSTLNVWQLRAEPTVRLSEAISLEVAFEQRIRLQSAASAGVGEGVLPASAEAPYRIRQLDWIVRSSAHADWRAEIDRAAVHLRAGRANVTAGRQAIGWGRGVLFGAVDLFAPFTPLEADREWRRGVDAIRADVKITDRISVETVAAFGSDLDHSIVGTRVRGYAGRADLEIMAGRRARDVFAGLTTSAALGDIELHGELAAFRAPDSPGAPDPGGSSTIIKGLAGGSYRVPVGNGLIVYGEYHYSGFGVTSPAGIVARLNDPAFMERYLRGDMQILGRHALAAVASYEFGPPWLVTGQWLHSPEDGSGVLVPSATMTYDDRLSFVVSGYVPYGRIPAGNALRSLFGAAPFAVFAQMRVYR